MFEISVVDYSVNEVHRCPALDPGTVLMHDFVAKVPGAYVQSLCSRYIDHCSLFAVNGLLLTVH